MDNDTKSIPATSDPLDLLKAKATELGIKFNANIGLAKLQEKIATAQAIVKEAVPESTPPKEETKQERHTRIRREISQLVRVKVTCLDPNKRNFPGEIISVGNSLLGTFKKYIPFDLESGYHIPKIILTELQERKCQVFYTVKGKGKRPDMKRSKLIKAYSVEILPPLTADELQDLANQQAINQSIDE